MKKAGQVVAVLPSNLVNVVVDGSPIPNVPYPSWYAPQQGDSVIVDYLGNQMFVDTCLTPGRCVVPGIQVLTAAPSSGFSQISTVYAQTGVTSDPNLALVLTTAPSGGTLTVAASGSRTWDPSNGWRTDDAHVRQGSFGSGANYGLWFYPPSAFAGLAGHTVNTVTMTVVRYFTSGASSGPMQLRLWMHNYQTLPASGPPTVSLGPVNAAGAAPARGQSVTFTLPASWGTALAAGTQAGIAVTSGSTADYMICDGPGDSPISGQLVINYT